MIRIRRPSDLPDLADSTSLIEGLTRPVPDAASRALADRLRTAQLPLPGATVQDIASIKQAISKDLAPFDALHILSTIMVMSMARDAAADFEPAATTEYVATVLLERADQQPTSAAASEPEKNAAVQRTLDRVRGLTLHGLHVGRRAVAEASSPIKALAERLKASDALNRWPGYETQIVEFMQVVFDDPAISRQLIDRLGFDASRAIACDRALRELFGKRVERWRDHVPKAIEAAEALWDSGERPTPAGLELGLGRSREQRFRWLVMQYFTSEALVHVLSFDDVELAEAANVPPAAAKAFIDLFTSPWGQSRGLTLLSGRNQIRHRPLLRSSDGRSHPTSPGNLLWALRPSIEAALKDNRIVFEAYQTRRAATVERGAARHLERALRPDLLLTNLNFETPEGNGETDVLARVDDLLVIVEAKAGVLSDAAYAGRSSALARDLERLLGKSTEQTSRLDQALRAAQPVVFTSRDTGAVVTVDLDGVTRFRSVVVTLENLSPIVTRPSELVEAGIIAAGQAFPWCVSLFDLEVIAGSTQFPAQLTSYLDARASIDPRAEWPSEDDLWMTHLLARLDFEHVPVEPFMVDGRTDLLAEQWIHDRPAPRVRLPKATKKALQRLSRQRPAGWLKQTEQLLDTALEGRRPKVVTPILVPA